MAVETSRAKARMSLRLSSVELANHARRFGEHVVNLCRVRPAGFGKIWPPAAFAAHQRRQRLDDISRVEACLQIGRDRRDDGDAILGTCRRQDDAAGLQLILLCDRSAAEVRPDRALRPCGTRTSRR